MSRKIIENRFKEIKRIVIKIGSNLIVDPQTNQICEENIQNLINGILFLKKKQKEVILVSSGAVAFGNKKIKAINQNINSFFSNSIIRKQALASIGQIELMNYYNQVFQKNHLKISQVLITAKDFGERETYLNIGHTIQELVKLDFIPVINENDTVSTDEIKFGDNDFLSAAVAALLNSQLLILLTSVEGFMIEGKRISNLESISPDLMEHAKGPTGFGSGGMNSKLRVGKLCLQAGVDVAILPGKLKNVIQDFFGCEDVGTFIFSKEKKFLKARKKWILFSRSRGSVFIDEGAEKALLNNGSSLLINGIKKVEGKFLSGDVVEIKNLQNTILGRGIVNISDKNLKKYLLEKNKIDKSSYPTEIIHRDNLILE